MATNGPDRVTSLDCFRGPATAGHAHGRAQLDFPFHRLAIFVLPLDKDERVGIPEVESYDDTDYLHALRVIVERRAVMVRLGRETRDHESEDDNGSE